MMKERRKPRKPNRYSILMTTTILCNQTKSVTVE